MISVFRGICHNAWVLVQDLKRHGPRDIILVPTAWIPHVLCLFPAAIFCRKQALAIRMQFLCRWDPAQRRARVELMILRRLLIALVSIHPDVRMFGQTPLVCEDIKGRSSLDVKWMPEPAHPVAIGPARTRSRSTRPLIFGSYGFARHEQGTDILQDAVRRFIENGSDGASVFRILWPCGEFKLPNGKWIGPDRNLETSGRVVFFREVLSKNDSIRLLEDTDWVVLPYRSADYRRRSSLLALDAICRGIPAIYTKGTFLEELFLQYGAGIGIPDGDVGALADAFKHAISDDLIFGRLAEERAEAARAAFSPKEFWRRMGTSFSNDSQLWA